MRLNTIPTLLILSLLVACGPARSTREDDETTDETDAGTCVKKTCAGVCGTVSDGCGGQLTCAVCDGGACTPETDLQLCQANSRACGTLTTVDRCGTSRTIANCGTCNGAACNGGTCGGTCTPETDLAFCRRLGKECGTFTDFDNCENSRTVASCGNCTGGGQCNVKGPNLCCVPETDLALCAGRCGSITPTDACGQVRTLDCGTCGAWQQVASPTTKRLYEVHGSSADNVWAGGDTGALVRWNGTEWSTVASPTTSSINGMWVNGPNDVWIAGLDRKLMHWNGTTWTTVTNPTPNQHYGSFSLAGSTLYAFGIAGVVSTWNGTAWTQVTGTPSVADYYGSWANSASDVWAVGPTSIVSRFDGTSWSAMSTGVTATFADVWASRAGNVLIVGSTSATAGVLLRWDGTQFLSTTAYGALQGIWGASGFDVYAVGTGGLIQHWDGTSWQVQETPVTERLNAVWGASGADVWAVGYSGTILRRRQ